MKRYVHVQFSRPGFALSSRFCPKMTEPMLFRSFSVAVECGDASYRQERCFRFPNLRGMEASLTSFYELIEGLSLSATATGKSHSHTEVPVVRASGGGWVQWEQLRISTNLQTTSLWRRQQCETGEPRWPRVRDASFFVAEHFFSPWLLIPLFCFFNEWHILPQCRKRCVTSLSFFCFLYSLTMLHAFPDDITRVTESTYFTLSFRSLPSSICLRRNALSA